MHKFLVNIGINEGKITHVFPDGEKAIKARAMLGVKTFLLDLILDQIVFQGITAPVFHFFYVIKKAHAKGVWVQTHLGHGRNTGVDLGKINLMAFYSVIFHEQFFMPVASPTFIHYFGTNLGLKKQRSFPYHRHYRFHPLVFLLIQKGGVLHDKFNDIGSTLLLFFQEA